MATTIIKYWNSRTFHIKFQNFQRPDPFSRIFEITEKWIFFSRSCKGFHGTRTSPCRASCCCYQPTVDIHSLSINISRSSWQPLSTGAEPAEGAEPVQSRGAELRRACTPGEGSRGHSRRGLTTLPQLPWPLHTTNHNKLIAERAESTTRGAEPCTCCC